MALKELLQDLNPHKEMAFSPVIEDNDELSQIIASDPLARDDHWDLHEQVDAAKLDAFWTDAVKELGPLETEQDDDF